jgi:hypothetical protein
VGAKGCSRGSYEKGTDQPGDNKTANDDKTSPNDVQKLFCLDEIGDSCYQIFHDILLRIRQDLQDEQDFLQVSMNAMIFIHGGAPRRV